MPLPALAGCGVCCVILIADFGLQEKGLDTVDANRALGLPDDCREYTSVRNILQDLGVKSVKLMVSIAVHRCAYLRLCAHNYLLPPVVHKSLSSCF